MIQLLLRLLRATLGHPQPKQQTPVTVFLRCGVCGRYARVIVPGRVAPGYAYIRLDDPNVVAWWNSHLKPEVEVLL